MNENSETDKPAINIEIQWPWQMLPLAAADDFIQYLRKQIGPGHPLYNREVFPSCAREDTTDRIVQFDLDDDGTFAIVYFNEMQKFGNKKMPRVEIIASVEALIERFEQDYRLAMENQPEEEEEEED